MQTLPYFLLASFSWSVILLAASFASFYGHWQLFIRYVPDIPRITEVVYLPRLTQFL